MTTLLARLRQIGTEEEFSQSLEDLVGLIRAEQRLTGAQRMCLPSDLRNGPKSWLERCSRVARLLAPPTFNELYQALPNELEILSLAGKISYRVLKSHHSDLLVENSNGTEYTIGEEVWQLAAEIRNAQPLQPWKTNLYSQYCKVYPSLIYAAALLRHFEEGSDDERAPSNRSAASPSGPKDMEAESAEDAADTPQEVFDDPWLVWQGDQVCWRSKILTEILNEKVSVDCKCLRLSAGGQLLGKISREDATKDWGRIMGQYLATDLTFSIPSPLIEDSQLTVELADEASGTHLGESLTFWNPEEETTRFDQNGKRQADAWGRPLPVGQSFSLCVPEDAQVDGPQHRESAIQAAGMKAVHFQQGWTNPILVNVGDEQVLWDSRNLVSPANQVPEALRDFRTLLVIDHVGSDFVQAHLEIPGVRPIQASIPNDSRSFEDLSAANALRFGRGGRDLGALWKSLPVRIQLNGQDGTTHWLTRRTKLVTRNLTHPLFLGKDANGKVMMLGHASVPETAEGLRNLRVRAVCDNSLGTIHLLQGERAMSIVPKAHEERIGACPVQFAARGMPITFARYGLEGEPCDSGDLMPGVVERGVIRKVRDFDEYHFHVEMNHFFEPTQGISPEGKHHRLLVLSQTEGGPGARLLMHEICGDGSFEAENGDWTTWKVNVKEDFGNVLGLTLCYDSQMLGCWTKGGAKACQAILEADNLTADEVTLLADFVRWFNLPVLDPKINPAVKAFIRNHAAAVLLRWAASDSMEGIGSERIRGLPEPHWEWMVRYLVMDATHGVNDGLSFDSVQDQIVESVENGCNRVELIRRIVGLAPACVKSLGDEDKLHLGSAQVADDLEVIKRFDDWFWNVYRQLPASEKPRMRDAYVNTPEQVRAGTSFDLAAPDPDWAELRCELARVQQALGACYPKNPILELWLNSSYQVNAALGNGVRQSQGQSLDSGPLKQLRYLMSFSAFARLLARKILHPALTIPNP